MFKNKTALITGANGGIGRALVETLEKKNVNLVCLIRKKNKNFLDFIKNKKKVKIITCDLTNEKNLSRQINNFFKKNGKLDILINNAGIASGSIIEMTSQENLKKVFEINFFAQIKISQLVLKYLKKSKDSSIINIGSIVSQIPDRGTLAYGCSKAALMHATKIMANEFSVYKIRVNGICPNVTNTSMLSKMDTNAKDKLIKNSYLKRPCEPKEISNLVQFLCSRKSKYINGEIINLDGGMI